MQVKIYDFQTKNEVSTVDLNKNVFMAEIRPDIIKRVVDWQLLKSMSGTHKVKTVSEISGTTKKPHKQKGTGMARQGSKRSVQMRGGAVSHGPSVRSHSIKIPKKVRQFALRSILSSKLNDNRLFIVDNFSIDTHKTKNLCNIMKHWGVGSFILLDGVNTDKNLLLASSNLYKISTLSSNGVNVYDIIRHDYLVMSKSALEHVEKRCSND
jgi:large subunit ribosomal protein L4